METTQTQETRPTFTRPNKAMIEKALVNLIEGGDDAFKAWMDKITAQGTTFYNYSFFNTWLIRLQCRDFSYVAGMKTWNKYGRRVKKGERAIRILAPNGENDDGKLMFRSVNVFDYSQTDGAPLNIDLLTGHYSVKEHVSGNAANMLDLLIRYSADVLKIPVTENDNGGNGQAAGAYFPDSGSGKEHIELYHCKETSAPAKLSILLHELGHAIMRHHPDMDKRIKEAQAQAFSYSLARYFAIDNLEFSQLYIRSYMEGQKPAVIYAVVKTIVDMAVKTIRSLAEYQEGLPTQRPDPAEKAGNNGN